MKTQDDQLVGSRAELLDLMISVAVVASIRSEKTGFNYGTAFYYDVAKSALSAKDDQEKANIISNQFWEYEERAASDGA